MMFIFFASLTVLGALAYNIGVKQAGAHINPFYFTMLLTSIALIGHVLAFLVYKYYFHKGGIIQIDSQGLWMAALAGLGVVVIDLAYFMAVKTGGAVASQAIWTVGGLIAITIVAAFFFKESISIMKLAGIGLGILGLAMIMRG